MYTELKTDTEVFKSHHNTPCVMMKFDEGFDSLTINVCYKKKRVTIETTDPHSNILIISNFDIKLVDDIDKIRDYIEKVRIYAIKKMEMIRSWLKTYISDSDPEFSGAIFTGNYNITGIDIKFNVVKELDSTSKLVIEGSYTRIGEGLVHMVVDLSYRIHFQPLYKTIDYLNLNKVYIDGDDVFKVDLGNNYISLLKYYEFSMEENSNLPDISEGIEFVLNGKNILKNIIIKGLKEDPLYFKLNDDSSLEGRYLEIRDFFKFFGWNENQNVTEVALKIWIFESILDDFGKYGVSIPLSILFLEKGEKYYNLVAKKLEAMSAYYVASLFRRGRLKILEDGIYLDGKKLEGELLKVPKGRGVIEMSYLIGLES